MAKKKANISLNPQSLKVLGAKIIQPIVARASFLVFLLFTGILIYSVFTVSTILGMNDDSEYRSEQQANRIRASFDKETVTKINNLKSSTDNSSVELPAGRRNPFTN